MFYILRQFYTNALIVKKMSTFSQFVKECSVFNNSENNSVMSHTLIGKNIRDLLYKIKFYFAFKLIETKSLPSIHYMPLFLR